MWGERLSYLVWLVESAPHRQLWNNAYNTTSPIIHHAGTKRTRCIQSGAMTRNSKNRKLNKNLCTGKLRHDKAPMRIFAKVCLCVGTADTSSLHDKASNWRWGLPVISLHWCKLFGYIWISKEKCIERCKRREKCFNKASSVFPEYARRQKQLQIFHFWCHTTFSIP